jgi:hypothetical protein
MDAKQLLAELSDDALRDHVTHLTERMRTQSGTARGQTYRQITRLLEVCRALSEETRSKLNRPPRRWQEG